MCGCEVHNNTSASPCTCLCNEHDHLFDPYTRVVRAHMRGVSKNLHAVTEHVRRLQTQMVLLDERIDTMRESMSESDGQLLDRLGTDAQAWAHEFVLRFQGRVIGMPFDGKGDQDTRLVTEHMMVTWFANAIEAGR